MWKKKLTNTSGMLLLYQKPQIVNIWMHNTYIPLDIIFIDENYIVQNIKVGNPLSKKLITSEKKGNCRIRITKKIVQKN